MSSTMRQPKLNRDLAAEIRRRAAAGERHSALAREYGVTAAAIYDVVRGEQRTSGRSTAADRILALLRSRPVARSAYEITEVLGAHKDTVSVALKDLRRRGLLEKAGSGHPTRYRAAGVAAVAASQPAVLAGNRPRLLGLRAAWLKEQQRHTQTDHLSPNGAAQNEDPGAGPKSAEETEEVLGA